MSSSLAEADKSATNEFFTLERMLVLWVRTSLSLISFGFTIYKFFQYLVESEAVAKGVERGPRNLGLSLVGVGTFVLLAATLQYGRMQRKLKRETPGRLPRSLGVITAISVSLIGIVAMAELLFRFGPF